MKFLYFYQFTMLTTFVILQLATTLSRMVQPLLAVCWSLALSQPFMPCHPTKFPSSFAQLCKGVVQIAYSEHQFSVRQLAGFDLDVSPADRFPSSLSISNGMDLKIGTRSRHVIYQIGTR